MRTGTRCHSLLPLFQRKPAPRIFCRTILFLALLVSVLFIPVNVAAQSLHASQTDVEAAYLYNFGKFVRWPGEAQLNALNICILGHDPFGASLDRIVAGERIAGHPITVTRLTGISGTHSCAMIFISSSEAPRLAEDMSALAGLPVMTVSDMAGFADRGGMIQFVLKDDRVRFVVNLNAAGKSGLGVSSQLLKVAMQVIANPPAKAAP